MKIRKLLSLALAALMVVGAVFTAGCTPEEEEEIETGKQTVTLNMFLIKNEETTEEAEKAVQLAINDITLSKYKTLVKLNYLTEDEYWDAVEAEEAAVVAAIEAKAMEVPEEEVEEEEDKDVKDKKEKDDEADEADEDVLVGEDGEPLEGMEIVDSLDAEYDALYDLGDVIVEEPQIDIYLVNSAEKYLELAEAGALAPLDTYLTLESKILSSYIYPAFLEAAKVNGTTYGIPVNGPIGSVEYIVFNKELLDKYEFKAEDMTTLESLEKYLSVLKANEPNVIPLGSAGAHLGFDAYGSVYAATGIKETGTPLISEEIISIYDQPEVKAHYAKINEYNKKGYLVTDAAAKEGKVVAVDFRKGNAANIAQWEEQDGCEYEYVTYRAPAATNDDLLGSVFVISANSFNKERSMEIIKLFNTNPVLANLLQWGIEGVHYELNKEDNSITQLTNDYSMNTRYTGNRYIKYRLDSEPADVFEAYKEQNLGVELSAFYGYKFNFPGVVEGDKKDVDASAVLTNSAKLAEENIGMLLTGEGNFEQQWAAFKKSVNSAYRGRVYDVQLEFKLQMKPYFVKKTNALIDSLAGAETLAKFTDELKAGLKEMHGVPGYDEAPVDMYIKSASSKFEADKAGFIESVKTGMARATDNFLDNYSATFDRGYYITNANLAIDELIAAEEWAEAVDVIEAPAAEEDVEAEVEAEAEEEVEAEAETETEEAPAEEEVAEGEETVEGEDAETDAEAEEEAKPEAPVIPTPVADSFVEAVKEKLAPIFGSYYTDEFVADFDEAVTKTMRITFSQDKALFADEFKAALLSVTEHIGYDYTFESVRPLIEKKATESFPDDAALIVETINEKLVAGGIDVFRINFMLSQFTGYAKNVNDKKTAELEALGEEITAEPEAEEEAEEVEAVEAEAEAAEAE